MNPLSRFLLAIEDHQRATEHARRAGHPFPWWLDLALLGQEIERYLAPLQELEAELLEQLQQLDTEAAALAAELAAGDGAVVSAAWKAAMELEATRGALVAHVWTPTGIPGRVRCRACGWRRSMADLTDPCDCGAGRRSVMVRL